MIRGVLLGILTLGGSIVAAAGGALAGPAIAREIGWVLFVPLTSAAITAPSVFLHLARRWPWSTAFLLPGWGFSTFLLLSFSVAFLDAHWTSRIAALATTLGAWVIQHGLFWLELSGQGTRRLPSSTRGFSLIRSLPVILAPLVAILAIFAAERLVSLGSVPIALPIALGLTLLLQAACVECQTCCIQRLGVALPERLHDALARVQGRTGVRFARVTFLPAATTSDFICEVRWRFAEPPSLVVSQAVVDRLHEHELLAVLCHEAGHIAHHHLRRRILATAITTYVLALVLYGVTARVPLVLRSPVFQVILCLVVVVFLRMFVEMWVSRRHEAEADRYAANVFGVDALSCALRKATSWIEHGHLDLSIWLSHEALPRRLRRLAD